MTLHQSSTAKAPRQPNKLAGEGGPRRFFTRNGEIFMVSEQGGYCLSRAETERMVVNWRNPEGREPWVCRMLESMADELEAVMAEADAPEQRKAA